MHYLNGYRPCIAFDVHAMAHEKYSAFSMYDLLANATLFPERYCFSTTAPQELLRRLGRLDAEAFEAGNLREGFRNVEGEIVLEQTDMEDFGAEEASLSRVVSFLGFKELDDVDAVCASLYRIIQPGGIGFHVTNVVHAEHDTTGTHARPLSPLTQELQTCAVERKRVEAIRRGHECQGFEVLLDLHDGVGHKHVSPETENFGSQWRLRDDELVTTCYLVVRRL